MSGNEQRIYENGWAMWGNLIICTIYTKRNHLWSTEDFFVMIVNLLEYVNFLIHKILWSRIYEEACEYSKGEVNINVTSTGREHSDNEDLATEDHK